MLNIRTCFSKQCFNILEANYLIFYVLVRNQIKRKVLKLILNINSLDMKPI